jgi:hypothetical protein
MSEIVGALLRCKTREEGSDRSLEGRDGACRSFAKEIFEAAERHLDRIEIRRVFWQIAQHCASLLNGCADRRAHMDWAVIHDDNVVAPKCRSQALLDISQEKLGGHGPFDHHRSRHLVATQGAHEGKRLPCPKRNRANYPDPPWSTPAQPDQIGADRCFVNKYQSCRVKRALLSDPTPACRRHVGPLPFGCLQAFF